MIIYGIDLSGPTNTEATALVRLRWEAGDRTAVVEQLRTSVTDAEIRREVLGQSEPCRVGLDAPLSYQPGGGHREGDRELRDALDARGFDRRSVLPPTMTRMIYLTARGMTVARLLGEAPDVDIAETHPASVMLFREVPEGDVGALKDDRSARERILECARDWQIADIPDCVADSDHAVAALAAAVAIRDAAAGDSRWQYAADPPHHPFPIVC